MTVTPWHFVLAVGGVVWTMLVIWNFSNETLGHGLTIAVVAWSVPMTGLYLIGRTVSWFFKRQEPLPRG